MNRIAQVHDFSGKGMGLAAPQIDLDHAIAVVRSALRDSADESIVLINPRITFVSSETDEKHEGCLSFFDVRGLVPRPLQITVESQTLSGETRVECYEHGLARLIAHEIDHLDGLLYNSRMRPGVAPIPVAEYRGTGRAWAY
ncbi:peptide deformylase [Streptosporangium sp. NPDC051023]|uniref:peptide deformylase n=1 Tax=Streptosporangium sp. NPDC051023 TaxID=3155410 RepID=UPI00344F3551